MFAEILREHIVGESLPAKDRCKTIAQQHLHPEDLVFHEASLTTAHRQHQALVQNRIEVQRLYKQEFTQFRSADPPQEETEFTTALTANTVELPLPSGSGSREPSVHPGRRTQHRHRSSATPKSLRITRSVV